MSGRTGTPLEVTDRLRGLIDGLSPSIFVGLMTADGILIEANRSALASAGLKPEDVLGKPFADTYWWTHSRAVQEQLLQAIARAARGEPSRYDVQLLAAENHLIDVDFSLQVVRDETGKVVLLVPSASVITERKQAEIALQRSEKEQRQLVRQLEAERARLVAAQAVAKIGSWETDLSTHAITWSAETYRIYETTPDTYQPTRQGILEFVHPDDRAAVEEALRSTAHAAPQVIEHRVLMPDGRIKFVEQRWESLSDDQGRPLRAGTCQDISARKQAEEALRTSLEEFHTLAEAMPQMVWITRPDGWTVWLSPQWMVYTGLTLEEGLGQGWLTAFHPEDTQRAWAAWQQAVATIGTYAVECRLRRADGVYRWWLIRGVPVRDPAGAISKWVGTCTDIHDLKVAQLEISRSEERFATVFQSNLIALAISETSSGRFIDVNNRAGEFFGYAREELIGHTASELGLWTEPAERERLLAGISAGGSTSLGEVSFRRKSGEIRHALVSKEAMTLSGISQPLVVAGIVDITERKQLESQLQQSQKMEAVGRLAGGVAHDFNNSLGVILGYTELLMRQAGDAQRGKLEQILKATQRASTLTRQLLAFSRKQIVDPKVLDLNSLVADLEKMLGRLIGEDIDLAIVAGANLGQVRADSGQLEQVVMNLCVNARDAMPGGGLLRIETANAELDAGHAARQEPMAAGRYVMVAVSDTGGGIEKAILSKIFEPFFTTKEEGKGTGLGLAMVYGIVKQAGGSISVYSEVGRGTTFKIYLPRIDEPLAEEEEEETPMPTRGSETVLLVEDEGPLRAITREILEEHGYQVLEAAGPSEAIELVGVHPERIHLLVTDVVMPGMNGRTLAEALVAARPDLKVLFMSGYTDDIIAQSGVLASGTLLLEKPFTARALLGRVRLALGEKSAIGDA